MSATPRSLLVGGPLDGETVSASQTATFVWVQLSGKGAARCYSEPQDGRFLYRLVHQVRPYKYLYAGHTHALCGACGGFSEVTDAKNLPLGAACQLCGKPLTPQNC